MTHALVPTSPRPLVPALVSAAGTPASTRFLEFFTAHIRNRNTRAAYVRAVSDFFGWCEAKGCGELGQLEPVHVAAYIEQLGKTHAAPSVKQHLAAVRMLFDWLVVGQVVRSNPASVVRGPSHIVKRGKTPVLSPEEARQLFERIPTETLTGVSRSGADWGAHLQLCADQCGTGHAGRRLLSPGQALVAQAA